MSDFYFGETSIQRHVEGTCQESDFQSYNVPISELIYGDNSPRRENTSPPNQSKLGFFEFSDNCPSNQRHQQRYRQDISPSNFRGRQQVQDIRPEYARYHHNQRRDNGRRDIDSSNRYLDHQRQIRNHDYGQNRLSGREIDYINRLVRTGQVPAHMVNEYFRNSPNFDGGGCTPIRWQDRSIEQYRQRDYPGTYSPRQWQEQQRRYSPEQYYRPPHVEQYRPRYEPGCQPRYNRYDQYRPGFDNRYYPGRGNVDTGDFIKGMILNQVLGGNRYQPYNRYQPQYYPQNRPGYFHPSQRFNPRNNFHYRNNDVGAQIASFVIPMVINQIQRNRYRRR